MSPRPFAVARFPIRFDAGYRVLSSALGLPPSSAYVDIDGDHVHVRMGWAFRSRFPLTAVQSATSVARRPLSRGVHGCAGRWLVNGSGRGILSVDLSPAQRAYVLGFPIRLRQIMMSVGDPAGLARALTASRRIHSLSPAARPGAAGWSDGEGQGEGGVGPT